eukprot:1158975-Pelagomonas_calceolata.AAC.23
MLVVFSQETVETACVSPPTPTPHPPTPTYARKHTTCTHTHTATHLFTGVEQHRLLGYYAQHALIAAAQGEPHSHVLAGLLVEVAVDGLQAMTQRTLPLLLHIA